jgi:hypothetical protein
MSDATEKNGTKSVTSVDSLSQVSAAATKQKNRISVARLMIFMDQL